MRRRLHFLLGFLTGLIIAAGIVRFQASSRTPPATPATVPYSVIVQPVRVENPVPKNWTPKQFNGQTYYLIPIAATLRYVLF